MSFQTAKALFLRLCDLPPADQLRELDELRDGDEALRREVEAMLVADEERPESEKLGNGREELPSQIGPFHVLRKLGEGGMGVVYLAEQRVPLERVVALKKIRHGFIPEQVLHRFGVEQAALARMDHPNIASVFEAAVDANGAPYFVMEYVDGGHITEYCDRNALDVDARVALMIQVCRGVHHAHQRGVLHRDLKPGNVLVTEIDAVPCPKIIDFGIARSLDRERADEPNVTYDGQLLGTPSFMSPEQLGVEGTGDVDTRADQYALGVMLYRTVTGSLPYRTDTSRVSLDEVVRAVRTERPVRPALRVDAREADEVAASFGQPMASVRRRVEGDLAWILEKALEKDRDRRFSSVAEFADDLQRFLDGRAVEARKPTLRYRALCYAKRHRLVATSIAVVCLALLVGAGTTLWQLSRAVRAEANATLLATRAERENHRFRLARYTLEIEDAIREASGMGKSPDDRKQGWVSQIGQVQDWMDRRAGELDRAADEVGVAIAELEAKNRPGVDRNDPPLERAHQHEAGEFTDAAIVDHRASEVEIARARVASERRLHRLFAGETGLELPGDLGRFDGLDLPHLRQAVMVRVGPPRQRWIWGMEAAGLAMARRLLSLLPQDGSAVSGGLHRAAFEAAAWAEFANGNLSAARACVREALERYPHHPVLDTLAKDLEERCAEIESGRSDTLRRLELGLARLEADARIEQSWSGLESSDRFLLRTLLRFRRRLLDFEDSDYGTRVVVERRLKWARELRSGLTARSAPAAVSWDEARTAIARADGVVASVLYREDAIELVQQEGLVPIGMNPVTKLWEFYHLRSAWDPRRGTAPRDLEIPRHDPETGGVQVGVHTGVVFVLVPGGSYWAGAQRDDPADQNYDPDAEPRENPPRPVRLAPFFLARHELTQGQWYRLSESGDVPSTYEAGFVNDTMPAGVDETHPVDSVSWDACSELLARHGLHLPTEAQWEYAARAGSSTPFATVVGEDSLRSYANGLGQETARLDWPGMRAEWSDGYQIHAPVGSFAPNAWGFFDLQGNVLEWCRDWFGVYDIPERAGDGFRDSSRRDGRVQRGGSFIQEIGSMRVSGRSAAQPSIATPEAGVRVSRRLHP